MALICINGLRECDGCGSCRSERFNACEKEKTESNMHLVFENIKSEHGAAVVSEGGSAHRIRTDNGLSIRSKQELLDV